MSPAVPEQPRLQGHGDAALARLQLGGAGPRALQRQPARRRPEEEAQLRLGHKVLDQALHRLLVQRRRRARHVALARRTQHALERLAGRFRLVRWQGQAAQCAVAARGCQPRRQVGVPQPELPTADWPARWPKPTAGLPTQIRAPCRCLGSRGWVDGYAKAAALECCAVVNGLARGRGRAAPAQVAHTLGCDRLLLPPHQLLRQERQRLLLAASEVKELRADPKPSALEAGAVVVRARGTEALGRVLVHVVGGGGRSGRPTPGLSPGGFVF